MVHLLIIDALNLIRRIHAASGSSCLTVCEQSVNQLLGHTQPTHAVAVFDEDDRDGSWRHQLLPDYKAGRTPMPDDLRQQLPEIKAMLLNLGIQSWHSGGDEADDVAATLATKVASAGFRVTIISTDKGYCQLLSPSIRIRDYFQRRWLDLEFIRAEFGVEPSQLTDYWGLTGVSSSKVAGVPGIGPKSATELLQIHPDLESLYQHIDDVPTKWQNKLITHKESAFISRTITTLRTDIQLNGNLQQLRLK
ncbi:flap endonuclease Xni [Proteus vulgaris]|uniref:flap endonuclease Xni n=1 Tax=Proteus vulgaris TaxID=585 RepID=UPI001B385141|nr:flap endonuclease Xni [Proteus vulgaris]MBQ0212537.1 flap endonuclease Xni [Proteus vulgaris]MDS0786991.1 flap endonuclease Xni [Proteus vulgaris]